MQRLRIITGLLWLLLASIAVISHAQDAFPIEPGIYEGNINDASSSVRYQFTVPAGQTATLTMQRTSGDLDPFLLLFDASGVLLADDDDSGGSSRDARIEVTPSADTTYIIEATRFEQSEGATSGTYLLRFELSGTPDNTEIDPLSLPPNFGVDFDYLEFDTFAAGTLNDAESTQYYALGGQQGDFVRIVAGATEGDLQPTLSLLDAELTPISRISAVDTGELIAYATLPQTGWYLLEVGRESGNGNYTLYTSRLAQTTLQSGETVSGTFTPDTPVISYIFAATINDRAYGTLTVASDSGITPELTIVDLRQNILATRRASGEQARVRAVIPRSGPYIVQVRSANGVPGDFSLSVRGVPLAIDKLNVQPITYNSTAKGTITEANPVDYYRFSGKAGELVTILMTADSASQLDPYVILADSNLNELAFNNNSGATRNARIVQYALPADGVYYILSTRPRLSLGGTEGEYSLDLTVGQLALNSGALMATLNWQNDADLNLFVRTPSGRTISWSNPALPNGGTLQIDSNTRCETPTAQPVEHVYWRNAEPEFGDYTIWVWNQQTCSVPEPVNFELSVRVDGVQVLYVTPNETQSLRLNQRYEAIIRISEFGTGVLNAGTISTPSPQQVASQGGDTLIAYGQDITGTISDEVYALFYQFYGAAGDTVIITAERLTNDLDPIVVLRDADDLNIARNDDAGDSQNSRLVHELPADGRYIIAVTRYGLRDGLTTGDFRLVLREAQQTAQIMPPEQAPEQTNE